MKLVRAVSPFSSNGEPNFKEQAFDAWFDIGGNITYSHYPIKGFRSLVYHVNFPNLMKLGSQVRLRFVEPVSISFDTFPDYMFYEIIPIIWDCWPIYYNKVTNWLRKYQVKTAIFTSSQTAALMRKEFPEMNILSITEGINILRYREGKDLADRSIDLLEYGSIYRNFFHHHVSGIRHINRENANGCMDSFKQLVQTMADAKVTIALPRCDTAPEETGGIETLTQRFWEGMLSRTVMLGRAPKELIDLIGYNPVIGLDRENPEEQVRDIVEHISDYQELVDKNHETATHLAPREIRMQQVWEWLESLGYKC